ncbi:MAG: metalloregulator ArsR/SmtB family transcription factor [Leptospira sp.]|jgi:DNA-binding transcriptional ArsR family regulator|nr:metalloregulator ArsR/SmtB family transcription factor [Leptospira sp.]
MRQEMLDRTFSALSDPTRRAILMRLSKGEATVQELIKPFHSEMSGPAFSKHLKVLEQAGLIDRSKNAQFRPCRINAHNLKVAADWVEQYRVFWEESFDRLDAYLKSMNVKKKNKDTKHGSKK